MYFVYVLKSQSLNKRYIGQTNSLQQRLERHNTSNYGFTRTGRPWILIYIEEIQTRGEAMKRERFLKSGKGREFLNSMGK